jgi:hypothetical protein
VPLSPGAWHVRADAGGQRLLDVTGNAIGIDYQFFVGPDPDGKPPALLGITPTAGSAVGTNDAFILQFSEEVMDVDVTLESGAEEVPVNVSVYENLCRIAPRDPMRAHAAYLLHVRGATDLWGKPLANPQTFSFTTSVGDLEGAQVVGMEPADGATGVATSLGEIRIHFSEPLDPTACLYGDSTVELFRAARGSYRAEIDTDGTLVFRLLEPLKPATTYTVTVLPFGDYGEAVVEGPIDLAGNLLENAWSGSFTTAP